MSNRNLAYSPQQKSIVVYSNWSLINHSTRSHIYSNYYDNNWSPWFGYNGISIAYKNINERSNFLQYELKSGFRLKNVDEFNGNFWHQKEHYPITAYRSNRFFSQLRFEIGKHKESKKYEKFSFEYGLAFRLFHFHEIFETEPPNLFAGNYKNFGLGASLTGNIEYDISKLFYLKLNASIFDYILGVNFNKFDYQDISKKVEYYGDFVGDQLFRFGVGFKINQPKKNTKRRNKRRR